MDALPKTLLRIGGIALLVYALIKTGFYVPALIGHWSDYESLQILAITLSHIAIPGSLGLIFVKYGGAIALMLVPVQKEPPQPSVDLEASGVTLLGVYLLYRAIADSVYHIGTLYQASQIAKLQGARTDVAYLTPEQYGEIAATAVEFAMGIWLIFGSKGLVNLFRAFRNR